MTAKRVVVGALLLYAMIAALFLAVSVADARGPDDRCLACATPRPVPSVIGLPVPTVVPVIPDTSTKGYGAPYHRAGVTEDTIALILIWWTAAAVIYLVWKRVAR